MSQVFYTKCLIFLLCFKMTIQLRNHCNNSKLVVRECNNPNIKSLKDINIPREKNVSSNHLDVREPNKQDNSLNARDYLIPIHEL